MGVVYKAYNRELKRLEALKMTRAGAFVGPRELARFRFEAEAAAALDHPNIVKVHSVGEVGGVPYLAMSWVEGGTLATCGPLAPREIATLMAKVARAVQHAHQRGILHRDLKPGNILLDKQGEPHVADFGIARRLAADATITATGGVVGTPAYMSPEQASGGAVGPASDIYSLGAVLYELLTGRPPYAGTVVEVLAKVQSRESPPEPHRVRPGADPELEAVCLKCLQNEPARRYASAGELADDLERHLRGQGVKAQPPGLWDWLRQVAYAQPERGVRYSWEVAVWFGLIFLVWSGAVFGLVHGGGSAAHLWLVAGGVAVACWAVLWWYMLRRFSHLPQTERHSVVLATGNIAGYLAITVSYVPFSFTAPAEAVLGMYPAMAALTGLGLFMLGSTNWSVFFPIGAGVIALAPVMAWWPGASPLVFGVAVASVMWFWGWYKYRLMDRKPE
jgi:serine/threonine-protein kinase